MVRTDFSVYDRGGQLAAVAEAKQKRGITRLWAANWARNYLAHKHLATARYLLLITPETSYFWNRRSAPTESEPTYTIDTNVLLGRYLQHRRHDPNSLSPQAFELLVGTWLGDLLHPEDAAEEPDTPEILVSSGFIDAVQNGHIEDEAAL